MSTLSKPKYVNRKATATIYSMLVSGNRPPKIYEDGDFLWVTNGFVGFAYRRSDFIFNPALFEQLPVFGTLMEEIREQAVGSCRVDSFKRNSGNEVIAKLAAKGCQPTYVNKSYLDMFSTDCTFMKSEDPLKPVLVISPYGEECGVILPVRHRESEGW